MSPSSSGWILFRKSSLLKVKKRAKRQEGETFVLFCIILGIILPTSNKKQGFQLPTGADFLVVLVLLRVSWQAALEAVLPELSEPGVPGVGVQSQLQIVIVKGLDDLRLQLHGDSSLGLLLIALHHLIAVRPAVTARARGNR